MHGWETRLLLKHYLDQGVSKAELSRRFGVSRQNLAKRRHSLMPILNWLGICDRKQY